MVRPSARTPAALGLGWSAAALVAAAWISAGLWPADATQTLQPRQPPESESIGRAP